MKGNGKIKHKYAKTIMETALNLFYFACMGALLTCMAMNIFSHASCPRRSEEYTGCTKIEGTECEELPCWC